MRVYVVLLGERAEGGSIVGIYTKKVEARKAALAQVPAFPDGWIKSEDEKDTWHNHCDEVYIQSHKVEE